MPYHPPLKIGSVEPFWPKIGHWEKMRYLFKMISTRPFPIDLALIHLRHNPEGPWHPPDTQLTPYRQPKMHVLLAENRSLWEKPIYGKMILAGLFSMNLASIYLKHNPECPRHPPDTLLTQFLKAPLEHSGWTRLTKWEWRLSYSLRGTAAPPCQRQTPSSEWW